MAWYSQAWFNDAFLNLKLTPTTRKIAERLTTAYGCNIVNQENARRAAEILSGNRKTEYHTSRKTWYDTNLSGMNVPTDIRRKAEEFCDTFGIDGASDPGYVCNVIALESDRGDGQGNFKEK